MSESEDSESPEEFSLIRENEDVISDSAKTIERVLNDEKGSSSTNKEEVIRRVKWAFSVESDVSDELAEELAEILLLILSNYNSTTKKFLIERDISDEILETITELATNYQDFLLELSLEEKQGEHYWWRVKTEETIRNGTFGFTHFIYLGNGDKIRMTTSSNSLLQILAHLISNQKELIERQGEEAAEQIDLDSIDLFTNNIMGFLEEIDKHRDDMEFMGESQKVDKEETLEDLGPYIESEEEPDDV